MRFSFDCVNKTLISCTSGVQLYQKFAWRSLDYAFPSEHSRMEALFNGDFVPENNLPVGIEIWKNKLFVTVPRWNKGVPSTLNYVPLDNAYDASPKLVPYPNWSTNKEGNCYGLTTTYRVRVDECDRLWVLDSGTVGIGNTTQQVCPYALHAFNLKNDRQILRYQFKDDDINGNTFIANIAVEVGDTCEDTFVYASDELGYGLLVYDLKENDSWRFEHGFFHPDPLKGDFNVAGLNFQWEAEGIFGLALSPRSFGDRLLFFHPLASYREFVVPTNVLKAKPDEKFYHKFIPLNERLGHSTAEVMTEDGILLFNLIDNNAIGCWNWNNPYDARYHDIIAKDDVGLIFPSDIRVVNGIVWVISDRMPVHLISKLDFYDVNFRIIFFSLDEAVSGTVCQHNSKYVSNNDLHSH
ncbi:protein yellow-like isoform X3 [Rhodnius prolixus]|uniref:protein yellow-like isoform X3 n=1 Tax=Rhodnius prolixus TaxID=13249 RepID=UPI003D1885EF